jgi:hypothetical protein
MMLEKVESNFVYLVGTDIVRLTVRIGDGQIGGSAPPELDGVPIGEPGGIENLTIGAGQDLRGKELLIKTVVSDESDITDWTSVVYELTGGRPKTPFEATHKVVESGNGVRYRTTISFQPQ